MNARKSLTAFSLAATFFIATPAWPEDQEISGPQETPADICVKDRLHRAAIDLQGKDYPGFIIVGRETIERYKKDCLPPKQQADPTGLFSRFLTPGDMKVTRTEIVPYTYEPPKPPRRH